MFIFQVTKQKTDKLSEQIGRFSYGENWTDTKNGYFVQTNGEWASLFKGNHLTGQKVAYYKKGTDRDAQGNECTPEQVKLMLNCLKGYKAPKPITMSQSPISHYLDDLDLLIGKYKKEYKSKEIDGYHIRTNGEYITLYKGGDKDENKIAWYSKGAGYSGVSGSKFEYGHIRMMRYLLKYGSKKPKNNQKKWKKDKEEQGFMKEPEGPIVEPKPKTPYGKFYWYIQNNEELKKHYVGISSYELAKLNDYIGPDESDNATYQKRLKAINKKFEEVENSTEDAKERDARLTQVFKDLMEQLKSERYKGGKSTFYVLDAGENPPGKQLTAEERESQTASFLTKTGTFKKEEDFEAKLPVYDWKKMKIEKKEEKKEEKKDGEDGIKKEVKKEEKKVENEVVEDKVQTEKGKVKYTREELTKLRSQLTEYGQDYLQTKEWQDNWYILNGAVTEYLNRIEDNTYIIIATRSAPGLKKQIDTFYALIEGGTAPSPKTKTTGTTKEITFSKTNKELKSFYNEVIVPSLIEGLTDQNLIDLYSKSTYGQVIDFWNNSFSSDLKTNDEVLATYNGLATDETTRKKIMLILVANTKLFGDVGAALSTVESLKAAMSNAQSKYESMVPGTEQKTYTPPSTDNQTSNQDITSTTKTVDEWLKDSDVKSALSDLADSPRKVAINTIKEFNEGEKITKQDMLDAIDAIKEEEKRRSGQ